MARFGGAVWQGEAGHFCTEGWVGVGVSLGERRKIFEQMFSTGRSIAVLYGLHVRRSTVSARKFSRHPRRRTPTPTHPLAPRRRTPTPRPRGSEGRVVVLVGPGLWISPLGLRIVGQMAYFPTCDSSDRARVQSPPCDGPPTNQPEEDAECLRAG
jgi:hypothetical protein